MMESYFLFLNIFSLLFDFPPNSRGTPADPSRYTSTAAHRLKIGGARFEFRSRYWLS
jgi:hypothetical protein